VAGDRLRVLAYNVHSQRDDRAALVAVVRAAAPDVVVVQEGPRRFRWRHKCAALAASFGMVVVAGGLPALGNLLLASLRVSVHRTWCRRYPLTPGRHLRGAVFAECSIGATHSARRFVVAGTHLSTDPAERPAQAALFAAALAEERLPVVVGADVNEPPGQPSWRRVADGLVDAAEALGHGDRATFPSSAAHARIDGLFVHPAFTVVGYDVIDTPLARRASDHLPVLADLLLPAEAQPADPPPAGPAPAPH
jgi:endonuclease/exonuclease/phosphatase family metal-dependent hydrolase